MSIDPAIPRLAPNLAETNFRRRGRDRPPDRPVARRLRQEMAAPDQPTFGVGGSVVLHEKHERAVAVTIEVRSIATDRILLSASGTGHL